MRVSELKRQLAEVEEAHGEGFDKLEVILRATNHETDDVIVCGIEIHPGLKVESGCANYPALIIDGNTEIKAEPHDTDCCCEDCA